MLIFLHDVPTAKMFVDVGYICIICFIIVNILISVTVILVLMSWMPLYYGHTTSTYNQIYNAGSWLNNDCLASIYIQT